jgi:AhpD family alkylhydroperoxidase
MRRRKRLRNPFLNGGITMAPLDAKQQELIAIGVSYAINCLPCMDYHKKAGLKAGLSAPEMLAALAVAESVRDGAYTKTQGHAKEIFGDFAENADCCPAGSACCC